MTLKRKIIAPAILAGLSLFSQQANSQNINLLESGINSSLHHLIETHNLESIASSPQLSIIIDPGHDDKYTGFKIKEFREENLTLELSGLIKSLLEKEGYYVSLTRNSSSRVNTDSLDLNKDKYVNRKDELIARANIINNTPSDIAIVIHYDALPGYKKFNEMRIHFYGILSETQLKDKVLNHNFPKDCKIYSESSKIMGEKLEEYMESKGRKTTLFGSDTKILSETPYKTALYLEISYLTSQEGLEIATDKDKQMETAKSIVDVIINNNEYLKSVKQDSSNLKRIK